MLFELVISAIKTCNQSGKETDKDNFKYAKLSLQKNIKNKKKLYFVVKIE